VCSVSENGGGSDSIQRRSVDIVLLDEPTTALDLPGRAAFLEAMLGVAQNRPRLSTVTVPTTLRSCPGPPRTWRSCARAAWLRPAAPARS
jgi:hypothetical protein